jgi:short subunit dehydrogenase-like uncharacterized protein
MKNRSFDLIVYGATSFVGQILTRYLFEHIGVGGKVNWAIAGRSEKKLLWGAMQTLFLSLLQMLVTRLH